MDAAATEELDIPLPDYLDRFLSRFAKKIGRDKEEVALFFLCNGRFTPTGQTAAVATGKAG